MLYKSCIRIQGQPLATQVNKKWNLQRFVRSGGFVFIFHVYLNLRSHVPLKVFLSPVPFILGIVFMLILKN